MSRKTLIARSSRGGVGLGCVNLQATMDANGGDQKDNDRVAN